MQLLWRQCAYTNDYRTSIPLTLTSIAYLEVRRDSFLLFIFSQLFQLLTFRPGTTSVTKATRGPLLSS